LTTPGSPPKRRCQNPWLMTATGAARGVRSSSGRNVRPSAARTPSTSKKFADTSSAHARSGTPSTLTCGASSSRAAIPDRSLVAFRYSM